MEFVLSQYMNNSAKCNKNMSFRKMDIMEAYDDLTKKSENGV